MYDQFLDHMKSDVYIQLLRHDGYNEQEAIRYSTNDLLCHIQLGLNEHAKSNSDFMIPEVAVAIAILCCILTYASNRLIK